MKRRAFIATAIAGALAPVSLRRPEKREVFVGVDPATGVSTTVLYYRCHPPAYVDGIVDLLNEPNPILEQLVFKPVVGLEHRLTPLEAEVGVEYYRRYGLVAVARERGYVHEPMEQASIPQWVLDG